MGYPFAMVYMDSTAFYEGSKEEEKKKMSKEKKESLGKDHRRTFVSSIIVRPYAVVDDEIARHGSWPTVAPVKP